MRDQVFDLLYQLPPERFVAARQRLASRLRDAGCVELAIEVDGLAEPTGEAWVMNLLAARQPDRVQLLGRLAPALASSVGRVVDGAPARELLRLEALRTGLIDQLVSSSRAIAHIHGVRVDEGALRQFLSAAASDPDICRRLQRGRLHALPVERAAA